MARKRVFQQPAKDQSDAKDLTRNIVAILSGPDVRSSFSDFIAISAGDHHAGSAASEWRLPGSRRSGLRSVDKGKWNNLCRPDQVAVRGLNHLVCHWA